MILCRGVVPEIYKTTVVKSWLKKSNMDKENCKLSAVSNVPYISKQKQKTRKDSFERTVISQGTQFIGWNVSVGMQSKQFNRDCIHSCR